MLWLKSAKKTRGGNIQEYDVNSFLEKLGLTEYEAKTLSALFRLKEAEAPDISRLAQVPKTRVYDVLDRLAKRNLVIEIHGRPKRYMSMDAGKVFSSLLEEKKKELSALEKEADSLKETITVGDMGETRHEKVMKVKDRTDFMKILGQEIEGANHSIHALTPLGKEHAIIKEPLKHASSRNVEIKIISSINEETSRLARELSHAGVKVRDFEHGMHTFIIDNKKVILALSDFQQNKPEYHFTIWPDNKPMATALSKYFEHAWEQGKEV